MRVFIKFIDKISEWTGALSAWIVIPLMLSVMYEVTARKLFNAPTMWSYDTNWMLYSLQFMVGGAYTLLKRGHIKIDIVYSVFSKRGKLIFDTVSYAIVILPAMVLFTYAGVKFAGDAWSCGEKLSTSDWFFPSGPVKTVIPVAFFLMSLQSLADIIRNILILTKGEEI
jgi:TRAP-type mannitol/chloroaromatic compound transport system permease small subunit